MRDILLVVVVFGSIPYLFSRPFLGIIEWTWLAYFNPHKMTFGFAGSLPFSSTVGFATLIGWLFSKKEPKKLPLCGATVIWIVFIVWMMLTTCFAIQSDEAWAELIKVIKIQVFSLLTVVMLTSWARVRALVWCIAVSLGYFGVKGGIWVISHGGAAGKVWGPAGTFIEGNNELGLALLMVIPLLYFLFATEKKRWVRWGLLGAMVLLGFSVAGSFSRGALLAAAAMTMFLVFRSRNRVRLTIAVVFVALAIGAVMPQSWYDRQNSIKNYQDDGSAMKRLNTWQFAWNYVQDNPVLGGGFEMFLSREAYQRYAPRSDEGWIFQDAHSNYMKVLAEHGFPGLTLFLSLFAAAWFRAGRVIKWAKNAPVTSPEGRMGLLARMLQTSIVAYAVGGSFLGLCYFDLPYNIVGLCIGLSTTVMANFATDVTAREAPAGEAATAPGAPPRLPARARA